MSNLCLAAGHGNCRTGDKSQERGGEGGWVANKLAAQIILQKGMLAAAKHALNTSMK